MPLKSGFQLDKKPALVVVIAALPAGSSLFHVRERRIVAMTISACCRPRNPQSNMSLG